MKSSLLTLLLLVFCLSLFAQQRVVKAVRSGAWQADSTWGGKVNRPKAGNNIIIPAGITVTMAKSPKFMGVPPYYIYDLNEFPPSTLTISGTLLLGDDMNVWLYGPNKDTTTTITVTGGGVIKGGNNGTHIKILNPDHSFECEIYEGGIFANPYNPHKTAHPLNADGIPMIVGPAFRSAATPEWCYVAGPLPITLVSFQGSYEQAEHRIKLEWLTSQEINNDHFTVERSRDAFHFEEVLQLPGAGNSSERLAYQAYDTQPLAGLAYYRLRQTDYDGQESYSKTVSVMADGGFSWQVSPNPSNGNLQIRTSGEGESLEVRVFNSLGKLLYQGTQGGWLPVSLSAGMYYVQVSKDGQASTQKVVVQ